MEFKKFNLLINMLHKFAYDMEEIGDDFIMLLDLAEKLSDDEKGWISRFFLDYNGEAFFIRDGYEIANNEQLYELVNLGEDGYIRKMEIIEALCCSQSI